MTTDEALGRIKAHLVDAHAKHSPLRDRDEAIRIINEYAAKAASEHNSGDEATKPARFGKRVLQLAGLCVRACVDLELTDAALDQE